jgi:soluble lytic murein transglycosylase-like protein
MGRLGRVLAVVLIAGACGAVQARAEIVYLATGRTMSVKGHREAGDSLVLTLRSGGEITCSRDLVARIVPDEVPYPEPAAAAPAPAEAGGAPYWDEIERAATANGVDPRLVQAVIEVESASQPRAVSAKGAMGLMQLMPETARAYGVANPFDPTANIAAGTKHLRVLLDRYSLSLALAAYNAGAGAVERYGGVPPFPETRDYVARVMARLGRN